MVTLLRHATSLFNAQGLHLRDIDITENGKQDCKRISGNYDLVICSTLKRARQTLDNTTVIYENLVFTDLCREYLDGNIINYYNGETATRETLAQLKSRIASFKMMLHEYSVKYKNILVISHYGFLKELCGLHFDNLAMIKVDTNTFRKIE